MSAENSSEVSEFIFLAFANQPELQIPIFLLFLLIYVISVVGNLGMIVLIVLDPHLHTPMYFFLSNLACVDFCYSSVITPKCLENFMSERKTISFIGCILQLYVFLALAGTEIILLALMAYDRYVAICNPLLYTSIMSPIRCIKMAVGAFVAGFLNSVTHVTLISTLSFCQSNEIDHFFCEIFPLLKLSCSDVTVTETVAFICAGVILLGSLVIILSSYTYILLTVLQMKSAESRQKAFSTCISHLLAVTVFFGPGLSAYSQSSATYSGDRNKVLSVFYAFVTPMLNPLIYSLRNKEVKDALKRSVKRFSKCGSQSPEVL
ncbi:olfactory receptor 5F1-like [Tiliqua scincoides]|uniref:olfactory receptor 5F1-like n=1 Tax=Tiliqua scincoides TaxID=71010 RepID=UPI003462D323